MIVPVTADGDPHSVRTMAIVIAWFWWFWGIVLALRVRSVDTVVPIVVMARVLVLALPTAILGL